MRIAALSIVFLASFLFCPAARAELNFCNSAPLTIQTVVGEPAAGGKWQSEGWWELKPGECATVIGGNLTNRYYYAFAETPGGRWKWTGDVPFCVRYEAFTIVDDKCQSDELRRFTKIDTGGANSFYYWFGCSDCLDARVMNAVQINIPFLEGIANNAAPLSYRTNDWQDIGPVDIQYGVSRSPFRLSINGNQVSISTRLSYWLSVSHTRLFGFRTGLASCGVDEAQPYADVTITTIFGINKEGRLTSKTRTYMSFPTRCLLTMFDIDATGYVQQVAQPQLDRVASTIDSRIGKSTFRES